MTEKYLAAIVRHEKAKQAIRSVTREIGNALSQCELDRAALKDPYNKELWDEGFRHPKTHLWMAMQHREPSSCGWGEVPLCEDGMLDSLSEGSSYECPHCHEAYRLIAQRKKLREELWRARLSIRALGRAALKEACHD
ncbi:hypothetical protein [Metapseudomonas otitidis]|uniref:hypothetical protein n=1 Tax=Metapseudomonas otitidis TaxID=319939 RepID=UPI002448F63D|nr:hypothetical protein [Pseudomonas otitidis]MDH0335165.1 hypothetical protein [Pseudomonas otitidis]